MSFAWKTEKLANFLQFLDYRTNVKINTVKSLVKNVPNYGASKEMHDLGFITFDLTVR